MYIYRRKYNFLIDNFNPKFKYFYIDFTIIKIIKFYIHGYL